MASSTGRKNATKRIVFFIQSFYPDLINQPGDDQAEGRYDQSGGSPSLQKQDQHHPGQRYQREQDRADIDKYRPAMPRIPALMQVVDQPNETGAGLRQLIFSGRAADKGIG